MPFLRVRDLQKIYRSKGGASHTALAGVSFDLEEASFTAVMGPSGSGKTTLLNLIAGLDRPTGGSIQFRGEPLEELEEEQLSAYRRRHLGFVFQDYQLLDPLTVEENVLLPLILERPAGEEAFSRVHQVLQAVGLSHKLRSFPFELSGGEQQRVAIARAVVHRPSLLLADEPTGNLDSHTSRVIMDIFCRLNQEEGVTALMVTHDPLAASYVQRVLLLRDGRIHGELRSGGDRREFYRRVLEALASLEEAVV